MFDSSIPRECLNAGKPSSCAESYESQMEFQNINALMNIIFQILTLKLNGEFGRCECFLEARPSDHIPLYLEFGFVKVGASELCSLATVEVLELVIFIALMFKFLHKFSHLLEVVY
jgi:hypothetical protein